MTRDTGSQDKARRIARSALDRKADRPVALDVSELTSFTEAFVIVGGQSNRQVRAIAEEVVKTLKQAGDPPLGVEGLDEGHWVLIDCNDVICHVFVPEAREHYDLERLWRDAAPIELPLPEIAAAGASGRSAQ